jgi:hypothetical protein
MLAGRSGSAPAARWDGDDSRSRCNRDNANDIDDGDAFGRAPDTDFALAVANVDANVGADAAANAPIHQEGRLRMSKHWIICKSYGFYSCEGYSVKFQETPERDHVVLSIEDIPGKRISTARLDQSMVIALRDSLYAIDVNAAAQEAQAELGEEEENL